MPRGSAPAASLSSRAVPVCSLILQSAVCQQEGAGRSNDSVYSKHGTQYLYTIFVPLCNDEERRRRGAKVWICISPRGVRNEARLIRFARPLHHMWSALLWASDSVWRKCWFYRREALIYQAQISLWCYVNVFCRATGQEPAKSHEGWETGWNVGQTVSKNYWKILVDPFRCWKLSNCPCPMSLLHSVNLKNKLTVSRKEIFFTNYVTDLGEARSYFIGKIFSAFHSDVLQLLCFSSQWVPWWTESLTCC